jgi:hypothetical protein
MKTRWFLPTSLMVLVAGCAVDSGPSESASQDLAPVAANADTLGSDYVKKSAADKEQLLWSRISAQPNARPTAWPDSPVTILGKLTKLDLDVTGDRRSDELPTGRVKLLHARGAVAKVELVPAKNTPYTGIFKGARGVARFSLASNPSGGSFTPGLALKFFVDGHRSKNMQVMFSIDGQGSETDFFANEFSNIIPAPASFGTGLIGKIFQKVSATPAHLDVAQLATYDHAGHKATSPNAPEQVWFVPTESTHAFHDGAGSDFRDDLAKIPANTVLYTIEAGTDAARVTIGSLVTRSTMVASEYGDQKLFFKHRFTERTHTDPQAADEDE